jgi:3-oxoacyl-(acyl-carrier-protein) synthase
MSTVDQLVVVSVSRVDADTEGVNTTQTVNGTWIRTLPMDFSELSTRVIDRVVPNIRSHVNTAIICSSADDTYARSQAMLNDRCRPRDVLSALGITLTKTLTDNFPNIDNIFKVDAACASGITAIDIAKNHKNIKNGVILVIGVERPTSLNFLNYFRHLGAVVENTESPYTPFDQRRSGFVMADGAAAIAITTLSYANEHQLEILATVDAVDTKTILTHMTNPSDTACLSQFIRSVILSSGKKLEEISWWDAHATATPFGDESEYKIFQDIFKDQNTVISSHKGIAGHCMSASALVELVNAIESVKQGRARATYGLSDEFKINPDQRLITQDQPITTSTFIKTSFGFGGRNGVAVITVC